jgi:Ion channel
MNDTRTEPLVATDATHLLGNMQENNAAARTIGPQHGMTAASSGPSANAATEQFHSRHSLTSEFEDFGHSSSAVSILLAHVFCYYLLAVVGYSFFVSQWSIVDTLYFATTLCTTIGFGDIAPTDVPGRLFTMFLALYGIIILGILLGIIGDYLVEDHNQTVQEQRTKVGSHVVHLLQEENRVPNPDQVLASAAAATTTGAAGDKEPTLRDDVCTLVGKEAPILALLAVVGITVGWMEGWSVMDSLYWLVITGTTVGFGDLHPHKVSIKLFCVVFLPFCVAVFGQLLGRIASIYMDRKRRLVERQFLSRALTLCDLTTMDADDNGKVDRVEFLSYMLVTLQKVSREDVHDILQLFAKLDVDGSHYLNKDDLIARDWDESFRSSISHLSRA